MKKKILITIADGFHYRYLIDTAIVKRIATQYDIAIVTIPTLVEDLQNYAKQNQLTYTVLAYEIQVNKPKMLFRSLYKKVLVSTAKKLTETLNIKNEINASKKKSPVDLAISLLEKSQSALQLLLKKLELSFADPLVDDIFKKEKIDFLITSTPGQKEFDLPLLFYAKKNHIKSVSPVYSWDNLTAKGPFYFNPDYLIVWNEIMKQEGIYFHDYKEDTIFACGVPVFDPYPSIIAAADERIAFKKSLGFDSDLPLVTLTTIPQVYYGASHLTLAALLLKERNVSLPDFLLLIRPHPMDETDYSSLKTEIGVVVDEYGSKPDKSLKNWKPTNDNVIHLGKTMKYSDVVLNIASTITIDAACFDTPIINIGFDIKSNENEYEGSIARYYKYTHYKHIVDGKACFIAESFPLLVEQINLYLSNPTIHQAERKALVKKQVMELDGNAGKRIFDQIAALIG